MRASRTVTVVAVVAALAVGRALTSFADRGSTSFPPFEAYGEVGAPVELAYGEVTVTDVRPARYVAGLTSGDLSALAAGVWVLVSVEATASDEPLSLRTPVLRDTDGRVLRDATRSDCPQLLRLSTGVPTYGLFCFDVDPDDLAGLAFEVSRGAVDADESIRGDHVAVVDLGISEDDEEEWSATEAAYSPVQQQYWPFELTEIPLEPAGDGS